MSSNQLPCGCLISTSRSKCQPCVHAIAARTLPAEPRNLLVTGKEGTIVADGVGTKFITGKGVRLSKHGIFHPSSGDRKVMPWMPRCARSPGSAVAGWLLLPGPGFI
jgi:hypothetical protein